MTPVFRLVDADHLRVTGFLDVAHAWQARAGLSVRVSPEIPDADLPMEREVCKGRLEFVDSEVNLENQTFPRSPSLRTAIACSGPAWQHDGRSGQRTS